ncbi:hypothetical protein A33Q_4041 [Indibacter alkaliphilus LW1]|uniref:Uncharacterized protein n=1 Tax=Indibacter alkaliphilus (strain CCUG 57479 / KCTC 22604 / LW1) TaxID=1189612 RepID=S2DQ47_INDAL|nr:hypothetical protein A33Q_4041 [Indibacter alkaliphilus LW1]
MTVGVRHPESELAESKACPAALRDISHMVGDSSLRSE